MVIQICTLILFFASNDNNVEWSGVSHVGIADRRPLCPINGEPFDVFFQTYRFDITSARVNVNDGAAQWVDAEFVRDRGPYAIWKATIPATAATSLSYYFELTDGSDTDYYSAAGMSDGVPVDGGFQINYTTLSHAAPGATPVSSGVVFKVWAPTPTQAYVRGQFNNWDLSNPMTRYGNYWVARVPSAQPGQMYKFFFNPGAVWKSDARSRSLNPGDNYNSIIVDPLAYVWGDDGFAPPAFDDMIIYELHVGTFAGRNDPVASGQIPALYADVAAHVTDLVELGVNVVELMPVNEYPWDFSAGYNPITMYAPESKHGSPDALRSMIDVLHQNGIAVLHDIVWNHFSPTDNFMWFYDGGQIYFDNPAVDTPWGAQADFDRPEVREYYLHSAIQWIEEFHIDGFRMDATDFMNLPAQEAAGWSLMQAFNNLMDNRYADKITIAEQLPDDPWVTRPTGLGGAGFDAQWYDAFVDNLRQEIFDAAFGDPEMFRIGNIINGGGQYLSGGQVVNYLELHDEAWPESGGQRIVKTIDPAAPHDSEFAKGRTKLAQGVVFTAPGIPAILQGTEWLEDTDFGGGSPSGLNRLDWSKKNTYRPIFDYYRNLIAIRKTNGALRASSPHQVYHLNESGNVIGWQRYDLDGNVIVVIANFSNSSYTNYQIGMPQGGVWYELLNSQSAAYDGDGLVNCGPLQTALAPRDGHPQSISLNVNRMALIVLRYNDSPDEFLDADQDGWIDSCDNCPDVFNPTQADGNNNGIGDACESTFLPGDMNCDGIVTPGDIAGFVLALTNPAEYANQFPDCNVLNADTNGDDVITPGDIAGFVQILTGG